MMIPTALAVAVKKLKKAKVEAPGLDARVLLAHILKTNQARLLAHPEQILTRAEARRFFYAVSRRAKREPVAYITGHKEFYGLDFFVNRHTLIPRPETELLIEKVLDRIRNYELGITVVDVGTGSGAIAVTLAKHLPKATVYATDISGTALRVARKNAKHHSVRVHFKHGNLLEPVKKLLTGKIIIVANLPYLSTATWRAAAPEVKKYEPRTALAAGPDGLRYYRLFLNQLKKLPVTSYQLRVTIIVEIDPREARPLIKLVHKQFPNAVVEIKKDLAKRDRMLIARLPPAQGE